ncbi:MAG: acetate kinase [Candidatus Muproteobacteria bacterium RBG_16_60_9]|uniref:Acetate kinase n=1 Tax=Candidatus Muproteobacteria bacterium RBG_16_60_9 TaxID=1817755 RepID=A0A1F6V4K2_9PROT|nr:MAG: acetate kinase [Candidatus Muproteobacteria bacterium RBG_16_60_9]
MAVLTVNAGSSSIRLAIFAADGHERLAQAHYTDARTGAEPEAQLRAFLGQGAHHAIRVVAHRVVHGGATFTQPRVIDAAVKEKIERLTALAPLHNPIALRWIEACEDVLGKDVPQIAAFDTAFYSELPQVAATYALPRALCEKHGLRRYGFHGLAHEAMWRRWRALRPEIKDGGRVISLQLGAGCSITAVKHGNPIDTSMGFTPIEGLVMATRSGDVDPGLLTYLQRVEALTADQLEQLLTRDSGLRGVAGEADMKALLAHGDADARLAVEMYCYRARKYIGAYHAALGGVDGILFGGGVGEHAPTVRSKILAGLESLGVVMDATANRAAAGTEARISHRDSRVEVWVIPVDEARVLARAALALASATTVGVQ